MLLAWPEIELVGVTTNLDVGGERAGCVRRILELAGRTEVPVVAGASSSLTTGVAYPSTAADARATGNRPWSPARRHLGRRWRRSRPAWLPAPPW